MKKFYEDSELELIKFNIIDIIATSDNVETEDPYADEGEDDDVVF